MSEEERNLIERNIKLEFSVPNELSDEDKLAKDISEKIKKDIDEMCFNYRLLGDIHNKDVEIREELQERFENLTKEHIDTITRNEDYRERIDKAIDKIQYIIDYGFDYDGFNNVEDLKGLIDMLVQYAVESRNILKGEDKE